MHDPKPGWKNRNMYWKNTVALWHPRETVSLSGIVQFFSNAIFFTGTWEFRRTSQWETSHLMGIAPSGLSEKRGKTVEHPSSSFHGSITLATLQTTKCTCKWFGSWSWHRFLDTKINMAARNLACQVHGGIKKKTRQMQWCNQKEICWSSPLVEAENDPLLIPGNLLV